MTIQQILSSSHCDNIKIYIDDKLVNQAIFSPSTLSQPSLLLMPKLVVAGNERKFATQRASAREKFRWL